MHDPALSDAPLPADRDSDHKDAIVVGGNVAGLTIAYLLGHLGYDTMLVDRAPTLGGTDSSFTIDSGARFDIGLHALDFMRSEVVTKLFLHVIDGQVHKVRRRRAIVLRNHQIPYNSPAAEWPEELRSMLPKGEIVDTLGGEPPTRENLARYYGREFVDFVFDEVQRSYPSEMRHLEFGVPEHELLTNTYPWFFPRASRETPDGNVSRGYHDKKRRGDSEEWYLYPKEGGFGRFAEAFGEELTAAGVEVKTAVRDLDAVIDPQSKTCTHVLVEGRELTADRVFWCGPVGLLAGKLGMDVPDKPDQFVLGSFHFEKKLRSDFSELLVGDPEHPINRASFPGVLSGSGQPLVQLEFAFPRADTSWPRDGDAWRERWLDSLDRLGIATRDNPLRGYDFKTFPILYNCYGIEGEPMPEVDFSDIPPTSNLRPVLPSIRNININTRVPQFLRYLVDELS